MEKIESEFKCPACGADFTLSSNSTIEIGAIVKCSKCKTFFVLKEGSNEPKSVVREEH